jgi:hypothetical protein
VPVPVLVPSPPPPPPPSPTPQPAAVSPPAPPQPREHTHLGALGEGLVFIDNDQNADWDLRRLYVRLTHEPTAWMRFRAEAGLEHGDSFAVQQAVLELSPAPEFGVRAGILLLPIGIINQLNAPQTFLTVDRPLTDQLIIPTIWRELGAGIFGELGGSLRYEIDVVRGLDGTGFSAQAPLAGGRGNGRGLGGGGAALAARLELFGLPAGFVMGASGYYGSASGGEPMLDGVNVGLVEADLRLRGGGFDLRVEYAQMFIFNSYRINDYLGLLGQDAISKMGRGGYAQVGYDVLRLGGGDIRQELLFFGGFETVNPRSAMSSYNFNPPTITPPGQPAPNDPSPTKSFVHAGIVYRPLPALAFKVDLQIALDAEGPPPAPPMTTPGAPGTPRPLEPELAAAARGMSRLGLAVGFSF